VAGHIRDDDDKMLGVDGDEIILVTCDGGHRKEAGGNVESLEIGERVRKDGQLNLSRHLKLRVDLKQLLR